MDYLRYEDFTSDYKFIVCFKSKTDTRYRPIDIQTGEVYDCVAQAPLYPGVMFEAVSTWIDQAKKKFPGIKLQIRCPCTSVVLYSFTHFFYYFKQNFFLPVFQHSVMVR